MKRKREAKEKGKTSTQSLVNQGHKYNKRMTARKDQQKQQKNINKHKKTMQHERIITKSPKRNKNEGTAAKKHPKRASDTGRNLQNNKI